MSYISRQVFSRNPSTEITKTEGFGTETELLKSCSVQDLRRRRGILPSTLQPLWAQRQAAWLAEQGKAATGQQGRGSQLVSAGLNIVFVEEFIDDTFSTCSDSIWFYVLSQYRHTSMPIRKHFDFLFLHLIIYDHLRNPRDVHFMPMHSPWDCHWRTPSFGTVIPSCCYQRFHSLDRPLKNVAPARSNAGKLQHFFFFRSFAGSETQWKM